MSFTSENIIDYLNGNLEPENEKMFFSAISADDELRSQFRSYLAIDKVFKRTSKSFFPSINTTNKIFSLSGFALVPNKLTQIEIPKPFYQKKLFIGLASGILSAIAAVLVTLILFPSNSNKILQTTSNPAYKDIYNITKSLSGIVEVNENNNKNQSQVKSKNILKVSKNNDEKSDLAQSINEHSNESEYMNHHRTEQSNIIEINSLNKLIAQNNNISSTPGYIPPIQELFNLRKLRIPNKFTFEVRGSTVWNIPDEAMPPSQTSKLNNNSLSVFYSPIENLKTGIELRQETFALNIYDSINNLTIKQQPNYTTFSLAIRYTMPDSDAFRPYFQSSAGITNGGYVLRTGIGIDFSFIDKLNFIFGIEYSHLFFNYNNIAVSSKKIGLQYGISYSL
ncbi:MAG: hypothetical protein ABSG15_09590 [FCB group bacterium]|jgi:hypothetical protein